MPQGCSSHGNLVAAAENQTSSRVTAANKNEVKISAGGIAKLTFNFLDELADSSLEPGEVKTPPQSPGAVPPVKVQQALTKTLPVIHNVKLVTAKSSKSQMDAQACQAKVRAILELDAIKRREEADIKKQRQLQRVKDGPSSEEDAEKKRLEKEERKRLKKLRKEKKAVIKLISDDEDEDEFLQTKKKKKTRSKEYESEDEGENHGNDMRAMVGPAGGRFGMLPAGPLHLPPPFPENFMGFHAMNPFMRVPRPDFHIQRGIGFHLRGRGGIRGALRFPGFRPPFIHGMTRHHTPMLRDPNPLPTRGHSPVLAPNDNFIWTTTKPSISYAFNLRDVCTQTLLSQSTEATVAKTETSGNSSPQISEPRKKSKKSREREKIKKRRSSRKSCDLSSKRKIEKIRKSLEKPERVLSNTPEDWPEGRLSKKLNLDKSSDSEEMWDKNEVQESEHFQLSDDTSSTPTKDNSTITKKYVSDTQTDLQITERNLTPEGPKLPPKGTKYENFDMFAESPPHRHTSTTKPTTSEIDNVLVATRKVKAEPMEKEVTQKIKLESELSKSERNIAHVENRGGTPPKKKPTKSKTESMKMTKETAQVTGSAKTPPANAPCSKSQHMSSNNKDPNRVADSANTSPKGLKDVPVNFLKQTTNVDKTPLQKAIEMQTRIDKLLKEDDLDASIISKIKAKSLEHRRRKEQEAFNLKKQNEALASKKPVSDSRRSLTPEPPKNLNNPFRRSNSRNRHMRRSRSCSPKHQLNTKRSFFPKNRHNMGGSGFQSSSKIGGGTLNRSRSGESEKGRRKQLSKSPRDKRDVSAEKTSKATRHKENPPIAKTKKNKQKTPLSFTAAEFFPIGEDDSSSQKMLFDYDNSSSQMPRKGLKKSTNIQDKDDSPDTDDYMDNWENDDVDLDINSSNACDSSTPMRSSSQEDVEEQMFVARFVNPSPPLALHQSLKASTENKLHQHKSVILATEVADKALTPPLDLITCTQQLARPVVEKELFGMQEIYDQFIKSVEESGVDLKSNESGIENKETIVEKSAENLSIASSTSSSTSSSSSASSSSDSNSSTSGSSSSSSSASSSEESNDMDENFAKVTLDSPRPKPKTKDGKSVFIDTQEKPITPLTPPLPVNITAVKIEQDIGDSPEPNTPPPIDALVEAKPVFQPVPLSVLPPTPMEATHITTPANNVPAAKAQKSNVSKDFKKLKSLEANLARIQMMRANYDSADEISEELLKMEKLFLQEKNLILQKYAKSSVTSTGTNTAEPATIGTHNLASLQQEHASMAEREVAVAAVAEPNKIFDANREAIKLTISPIKLPKTPAIFEKPGAELEAEEKKPDLDETDFTEKLKRPVKEVAIVKPMMETKDTRHSCQQRSRRPSPAISRPGHESRPRSPNSGYHRERRRSTSRSRLSPQRRQRLRSLSVSPPSRRNASGRYGSPGRRGTGNNNSTFATTQSRYRNSGRRSRSRSRSITRQSSRRRSELSPQHSRSRRPPGTSSSHCPSYYRKSSQAQQRSFRDSRSRSRSSLRSPPPRPQSPRSPPPLMIRRRSYSRDRYSSRSPLPFKPPSPPMRRSLSPHIQRRSSLSPTSAMRSSSSRHSPHSPRSRSRSRSPRYDDHRRRRANSYDRRSPSLQHQYFMQDPTIGGHTASPYYYNLSPNRISLDARINIVLNGPPNQESGGVAASYDSYSSYSQYGGQYMSVPPHADAASYSINYAGHQYVPMSINNSTHSASSSSHKPVYSNIPTIGGGEGMSPTPAAIHPNYYYSEFGNVVSDQHSTSVLKELPKATVAVQKGNVLEIVPTSEMNSGNEATSMAVSNGSIHQPCEKPAKSKNSAQLSWKEEVKNRHVAAAVMRLSRENEGSSKGILKMASSNESAPKEESANKSIKKKKVFFEDGIFPNHNSEEEDRNIIDARIRRKLRRLRKIHGITIHSDKLVKKDDTKSDSAVDDIPPPPPPPGIPPKHLEQPIYLRPPTPTPLLYFHFDSIVHSMYVSQSEEPVPPRLLNPKALPPSGTAVANTTQSPANTQSPNGASPATNALVSKKDLSTLAAINRSSRGSDRSSPKLTSSSAAHRRDNRSTIKTMPIETIHTENSLVSHKSSFQSIPTNVSSASPLPQIIPHHTSPMSCVQPAQRQCAPIGFMGMRINNFMRLPPSPLARSGGGIPTHGGQGMPVHIGMRHSFSMPPPTMMPPNGHGQPQQHPHLSPLTDFSAQQQSLQYHPQSSPLANSPHMHHVPSYPVQPPSHHTHPVQFAHIHHPPPVVHASHVQHQRQQSPQFFVQSIPPPPLPPNRIGVTTMHGPSSDGTGAEDTNAQPSISVPAPMISPYNIKRQ